MTRQLTRGEEHAFDGSVDLVEEEHADEADPHGTHEVQDDHPPHRHTCPGAQQEQRCRHFSPLNALKTRLPKPSDRRFTFSLNAQRSGEAALLQEVRVASLDRHTVPGPRLQARQGHQVGLAAQVPDI